MKRLIFKILKETKQMIKEEQDKVGFVDERKIANNELTQFEGLHKLWDTP